MTDNQPPSNPWDRPADAQPQPSSSGSQPYHAQSFDSGDSADQSQNPYAAPQFTPADGDSFNSAAAGTPGAGFGDGAARGGEVPPGQPAPGTDLGNDLGQTLSWAFKAFGKNLKTFLIPAAIYTVLTLIGIAVTLTGLFAVTQAEEMGESPTALATILMIVGYLSIFLIAILWQSGAVNAAAKIARGEKPSIGQAMFSGKVLITYLACNIITGIGFVLCIVPGIAAGLMLWAAPVAAVIDGVGVGEALKRSFNAVKQNPLTGIVGFLAIYFIVSLLASTVVGMLVAVPFGGLGAAALYMRLTGRVPSEDQVR